MLSSVSSNEKDNIQVTLAYGSTFRMIASVLLKCKSIWIRKDQEKKEKFEVNKKENQERKSYQQERTNTIGETMTLKRKNFLEILRCKRKIPSRERTKLK